MGRPPRSRLQKRDFPTAPTIAQQVDYDYGDNSIQVQSTMLRTMKSELLRTMKSKLLERSSNTNIYVMVVELEALFASQVIIMMYEYLDKFFFN
jgi:hypothetical protein